MRRWVDVRRWLAVAALGALAFACQSNPPVPPVDHSGTAGVPEARTDPSSANDPANGTVVMFGGATRSGVLDETWTWDGSVWRRQHPATSPSPREFAYMAYDPATSRVILFGGFYCAPPSPTEPTGCDYQEATATLHDTWSWDGRDWTQVHTTHAPAVQHFRGDSGAMDADTGHGELLLLTWPTVSQASSVETWRFHGDDWQLLAPAHSVAASEFSGPAYDAVSKRLIVQQIGFRGATYWWDGSDWHVFDLSVKTPAMYGRLLSTGRHGLLLIASDNSAAWNGRSWGDVIALPPSFKAPALRYRAGWTASYHEPTQQLVLYGGRDSDGGPDLLGSTAVWDGTTWKVLVPASSPSLPAVLGACSPLRSLAGLGSGPITENDPYGAVFEVQFGEPPSGPCHLNVAVTATLVRGMDVVTMVGNPATQQLDMDLKPRSGEIAAVFDVHGACTLGSGVTAQLKGGDFTGQWDVRVYSGCTQSSPVPLSITSSIRRFPGP